MWFKSGSYACWWRQLRLPILMCLLFGLGYLLTALKDDEGAVVVVRTNLVLAVLWVFDVLLLVIAMGLGVVVEAAVQARDQRGNHHVAPIVKSRN